MFYKEGAHCYFIPAFIEGGYAYDVNMGEYLVEASDDTKELFVRTSDGQTHLIEII